MWEKVWYTEKGGSNKIWKHCVSSTWVFKETSGVNVRRCGICMLSYSVQILSCKLGGNMGGFSVVDNFAFLKAHFSSHVENRLLRLS